MKEKTIVARRRRCGFGFRTLWYEKTIVIEKDSVIKIPR